MLQYIGENKFCEVTVILIKILDRAAMGEDTPFGELYTLGEVVIYERTAPTEVCERIKDADIVIVNKVKLTGEVLAAAEGIKLVCTFATGYDNVDVAFCKSHGIAVCNVPAYSTDSVALMTVATVLALQTKLYQYSSYVSSGEYTRSGLANKLTPVYHEISEKRWGIIGYGNIGQAVARVARALGAKVSYYKRTPDGSEEYADVDTICRECDIITLHCPLNDESRHLIDESRLRLMKSNAILVNEARGAVVSEAAVADAVLTGKISAFGCDVYSTEPFGNDHPYQKIMGLDNVILTPHAAWGSYEARERCVKIICDNIRAFTSGDLLNRVDQ